MSTIQIILIFLVACISGMGSVLDEFQTYSMYAYRTYIR
mgnify:CR=1 FL=1